MTTTINNVFFDTHASVKKLLDAGFTEKQAEAQTKIISDLVEKDLVTKAYLDMELAKNKAEIIKWITGLLLAQTGIIAALVKLL